MEKTYDITKRSDLDIVAKEILSVVSSLFQDQAVVLALQGDLGAGKTTFVQSLASLLEVEEVVTSPTFVIMKLYKTKSSQFPKLVHVDAYRIESIDEMRVLGFASLLAQKDTIICIEWAENIVELLPEDAVHLYFKLEGEKRVLQLISN